MLFSIRSLATVPLVWMRHSRALNNEINRLHERYQRLIYNDKQLTFENFLKRMILSQYIQTLPIEMYKDVNGGSAEIMKETFRIRK